MCTSPVPKNTNIKSAHSRANDFDIYGLRPFVKPWRLLSVYEFLRYWTVEPLLIPTHYENKGVPSRSQWTAQGLKLRQSSEYKAGNIAARAGQHYVAIDPGLFGDYHLFPEEPADVYSEFRHSWVLGPQTSPSCGHNSRTPSTNHYY